MEWFKHKTASGDDPDIIEAEDTFGDAGYNVFFKTLEVYGDEYSKLDKGGNLRISKRVIARKLRKRWTRVELILNFYQKKSRIFLTIDKTDENYVFLNIPIFIELASNWTRRPKGKPTEAPTEAPTAIEEEVEEEVEKSVELPSRLVPYQEIISYLNRKANTHFKHTTKATRNIIKARCNEGFELDAFKYVIDVKCSQWLTDPRMVSYLRPQTLFGTKFESYLNEVIRE